MLSGTRSYYFHPPFLCALHTVLAHLVSVQLIPPYSLHALSSHTSCSRSLSQSLCCSPDQLLPILMCFRFDILKISNLEARDKWKSQIGQQRQAPLIADPPPYANRRSQLLRIRKTYYDSWTWQCWSSTTEDLQYLNAYLDVLRDFVFVSDNIHIQNHSRYIVVNNL